MHGASSRALAAASVADVCLGQVGCIISICFGVPIGRKRSIMFGCCWVTVGGAIQAASFGTGQLYAGRVIAGVGTGLVSSAIPIWLSECTRAGSREFATLRHGRQEC